MQREGKSYIATTSKLSNVCLIILVCATLPFLIVQYFLLI